MTTGRLPRVHARFDQIGFQAWVERDPRHSGSQMLSELSPRSYDYVFRLLKQAAGDDDTTLCDLGAGCGRALAHAVASGAFVRATGVEIVQKRVDVGLKALADLRLTATATLEHGDFCSSEYAIDAPCVLCYDLVFELEVLRLLATKLNAGASRAMVSFKSPQRWEAAGLTGFSLVHTGRVDSTSDPPERFTFFVYTLARG